MLEMKLLKTMEDEEAVRKAYEIGCYVAYVTSYKTRTCSLSPQPQNLMQANMHRISTSRIRCSVIQ